jgi:hypothetical protein
MSLVANFGLRIGKNFEFRISDCGFRVIRGSL